MRCTVVGQHLKILSKSVRLMSKYSEYVILLAKDNGLVLQAVNDSKSAFCEVIFRKDFFATYDFQQSFECRVDIKSLTLVFRIINLDRIVENCKILMDSSLPKIVFEMKCKYGVFREYFIPYMESEVIRCSRISGKIPNPSIKAPAKVFSEIFKHFAHSTREATVWLFNDHMSFKTFIENDHQNYYDLPSTSFSYMSREFTLYNYSSDISVTFNVRDIRAFFDFALHHNQLVSIYFQSDAKPIECVFQNNSDNYSARIIMATVEFPESEQPVPPPFNENKSANLNRTNQSQNTSSANESLAYSMNDTVSNADNVSDNEHTLITNKESSRHASQTLQSAEQIEKENEIFSSSEMSKCEANDKENTEANVYNDDDDLDDMIGMDAIIENIKNSSNSGNNNLSTSIKNENMPSDPQTSAFFETTSSLDEKIGNIIVSSCDTVDHNTPLQEEISNIVDILDNLPDFSQGENYEQIPLTGTQLRQYQHNFLFGDRDFDDSEKAYSVIVPDSDED